MARSQLVTCANCGQTKNRFEYAEYEPATVPGEESHDWSIEGALAGLVGDIDGVIGAEVIAHEDNPTWQWADVRVEPEDDVTASEMLSNVMKRHGFNFCGLDMVDGAPVVRVNRKKGGD
jgi:hypothetical protein